MAPRILPIGLLTQMLIVKIIIVIIGAMGSLATREINVHNIPP